MNLLKELNDLHLEGLKVEAVLKAIDCTGCEIILSVATEQLDQMLANLEMIIYKSMRKENVA